MIRKLAALGALALVVAWAPAVSGQQVVVQKREPVVIARTLGSDLGGVRLGVSIRDLTPDDVSSMVRACATDPAALFELTDSRGRRVLVPADKLAYVELGEQEARRVGFGAM